MMNQDDFEVQDHLVAFIDILGQSSGLKRLTKVPEKAEYNDEMVSTFRETAGKVLLNRMCFEQYLYSMVIPPVPTEDPETRKFIDAAKKIEITFRYFSDSIILSVPLGNRPDRIPMSGVYSVLVGVAGLMGITLSGEIVMRAGIDIGACIDIDKKSGEIYGAAIERAYRLENSVAIYPRIVLGNNLLKYLNYQANLKSNSPYDVHSNQLAKKCLSLVSKDKDSIPIIDYYGAGMRNLEIKKAVRDEIEKSFEFATNQIEVFKKEGNEEIVIKYEMLKTYIESRMGVWGIKRSVC